MKKLRLARMDTLNECIGPVTSSGLCKHAQLAEGKEIECGFWIAGDIEMASPMAASLGRPSVDNSAARKSMSASRHQLSGFMRSTSKDLGALVRDSRHNLSASGRSLPGAEAGSKGMVLPFIPLNLTFSHLNYYVDLPKVCLKI